MLLNSMRGGKKKRTQNQNKDRKLRERKGGHYMVCYEDEGMQREG